MSVWTAAVVTGITLIGLPWLVIRWTRQVQGRPRDQALVQRWVYRIGVLGLLLPLGTYLLIGSFVHVWGWAATLWIFGASALRGLIDRDA
jgi:hypothetical protein